MNSQLEAYIKQSKASGQTDEQIKKSLLQSGWSQEQVNEAFGIPNPQGSVVPPPPAPPQFQFPQNDYTKFDEKTIATIKTSAIWNGVAGAIRSVGGMLATYYFTRSLFGDMLGSYFGSNVTHIIDFGVLLSSAVWAVIYGAIAGWALSKFYSVFVGWQQRYLGNKLNNLFKLLFWPYVASIVLNMVMSGLLSTMFSGFFSKFIIVAVVDLIAVYIYAKMMDKTVGKYYK